MCLAALPSGSHSDAGGCLHEPFRIDSPVLMQSVVLRAATMVVTGGIIATMLLYDWGGPHSQDNIFSSECSPRVMQVAELGSNQPDHTGMPVVQAA